MITSGSQCSDLQRTLNTLAAYDTSSRWMGRLRWLVQSSLSSVTLIPASAFAGQSVLLEELLRAPIAGFCWCLDVVELHKRHRKRIVRAYARIFPKIGSGE